MTETDKTIVPVWTLATREVQLPTVAAAATLSGERLAELRGALASLADQPIATLEQHPLPERVDRSRGIPLDAASPLAQHLSQLITTSTTSTPALTTATAAGEGLFRMVVPAKFAAQFGQGIVRSMPSTAARGGIYGSLVDSTGIVSSATFVPVTKTASMGAVGGASATAGAAVVGGTALTLAAPLVLMAVAVGASAHADQRRQQAIERITELLEQLADDQLNDERADLEGCRDAVDKATAVLLDQGKLGVSLGLDSAVHAIGKSLAASERRLTSWRNALAALAGKPVEVGAVTRAFPGVDDQGGLFRAHLELASLAIALKRRVIILQAVEIAQSDPGNEFENFTRSLAADQQRVDELESSINRVLVRLSELDLTRPMGKRRQAFTATQVDRLLRATNNIRRMGDGLAIGRGASDVSIEIVRNEDGSVVVFPALSA